MKKGYNTNKCKVETNPTPANRSMNKPLKVQKVASPANRKMNAFPKVKK